MTIHKLPATAGIEWLLQALVLLRKSPGGLGLLGLIYALVSALPVLAVRFAPGLAGPLQLATLLLAPLLMAGMIYAASEVDAGRSAMPTHLLRGVEEGKVVRLLGWLLPQLAILFLSLLLLVVILGPQTTQQLLDTLQKLQTQATPDPALLAQLPIKRLLLWIVLAVAVTVVATLFTLTTLPDMMLGDAGLFTAMRRSFQACMRNFGAVVVFLVLLLVVFFGMAFVMQAFILIAYAAIGPAAVVIGSALFNGVLATVLCTMLYVAWKQMLGGDARLSTPSAGIEV